MASPHGEARCGAEPGMAENHALCLFIGTSMLVPVLFPPSHLSGGESETFPPLPSPSLLTKRWLSAQHLPDHCHILFSDQTAVGRRHLTDQHLLLKWKVWVKSLQEAPLFMC